MRLNRTNRHNTISKQTHFQKSKDKKYSNKEKTTLNILTYDLKTHILQDQQHPKLLSAHESEDHFCIKIEQQIHHPHESSHCLYHHYYSPMVGKTRHCDRNMPVKCTYSIHTRLCSGCMLHSFFYKWNWAFSANETSVKVLVWNGEEELVQNMANNSRSWENP